MFLVHAFEYHKVKEEGEKTQKSLDLKNEKTFLIK